MATPGSMRTRVSEVHLANARVPTFWMLPGSVRVCRRLHPANAISPICSTVRGMITRCSC